MAVSSCKDYDEYGQLVVLGYHATAVIDIPSSYTLRMCDPHGSATNGYVDINYYTAGFYSSGLYYTWDSGYYSYLTY